MSQQSEPVSLRLEFLSTHVHGIKSLEYTAPLESETTFTTQLEIERRPKMGEVAGELIERWTAKRTWRP